MQIVKNQSMTKNTIFYLIYNVLNIFFPFVTGIYVARVMSPQVIGTVSYAQNLVQYFVLFSFLGIPTYGVKEIAKVRHDKGKLNKLFSELFIINLISTILFSIIYLMTIIIIPDFRENITLYLIVGSLIVFNALNISWLYEGIENFRFISIRNIIFKILSFLFLISFVKSSNDIYMYALVTVIGTGGNNILNMLFRKTICKITFKNLNFKRHMRPVLYLVVVNLAIEIYSLVDVTMIGFFSTKENVTYYTYASKIQKILLQVINSFTLVIVPRLSLLYSKNDCKAFNNLISKTFYHIVILALPIVIGIQFIAKDLITILYGARYIQSAYILKLLSVLIIISPIGYLLGSRVCLVTNNEKAMIISVIIGAILNTLSNYILIPKFNAMGASFASVISELAVMIIYVNFGKKHFKLYINKHSIISIIVSCFFMSGYLFLSIHLFENVYILLFMQIVGSCLLYFGILLILKEENVVNVLKKINDKCLK